MRRPCHPLPPPSCSISTAPCTPGGAAIPGAAETLARLRRAGVPFRLVTNTTSRSRRMLVERLRGIRVRRWRRRRSSRRPWPAPSGPRASRPPASSRRSCRPAALEDMEGLELAGGTSGRPRGRGRRRRAGRSRRAVDVRPAAGGVRVADGGAALVALSRDRYFRQGDRLALDAGPFVAALEYATGATAAVAGKPSPAFYAAARRRASASAAPIGRDGGRRPLVRRRGRPARRARRGGWSGPASFARTCCAPAASRPTGSCPAWPSCPDAADGVICASRLRSSGSSCRWSCCPSALALAAQAPLIPPPSRRTATRIGRPGGRARAPGHLRSQRARTSFARLANALHIQTRAATIRRELLFRPGEPYDSARVAESERNLRALGVFRRVTIDSVPHRLRPGHAGDHQGRLEHPDRLAIPQHRRRRRVHRSAWWRTTCSAPLRQRVGAVPEDPRPEHRRARLPAPAAVRRAGRPGAGLRGSLRRPSCRGGALEQPFYSMTAATRSGWRARTTTSGCCGSSRAGQRPATPSSAAIRWCAAPAARALQASSAGYVRLGVQAQVRRDDFVPEGQTAPFARTVTGAFGPYVAWNHARFVVTKGVAGFAREEDVDLGTTVTAQCHGCAGGVRLRARRDRAAGHQPDRRRACPAGSATSRDWPEDSTPARARLRSGAGSGNGRAQALPAARDHSARRRRAGWRIRCRARSSIWVWASGRAPSAAMPSPGTGRS